MSRQALLNRVVQALGEAGVEYMVTDSLASSYYGEPRLTHDIDVVVSMAPQALDRVLRRFPTPEYWWSAETAQEALRHGGSFNRRHTGEGDKVDFWMLTDAPFDRERFRRRRATPALGHSMQLPTPEDVILQKLHWAKLSGGSERHFLDALRIYEVQRTSLDRLHIDSWAEVLGVEALWTRIQREGEETAR